MFLSQKDIIIYNATKVLIWLQGSTLGLALEQPNLGG